MGQEPGSAAVSAAHICHDHPRAYSCALGAMPDQHFLGLGGRFTAGREESMMDVVTPIHAVCPGELVIVIANIMECDGLLLRSSGGCHLQTLPDKDQIRVPVGLLP